MPTMRHRLPAARVHAHRPARTIIMSLAALMVASAMLCGCVVETPGHGPHPGWWWHHDDR